MHSRRSLRTLQPLPLPMKNLINSRSVLCESDRETYGSAFARPETNLCFCEKVRLNWLHRRAILPRRLPKCTASEEHLHDFVPPGANQTIRAKLHTFKRRHVEKSGVRRLPRFFLIVKINVSSVLSDSVQTCTNAGCASNSLAGARRDFGKHADIDRLFLFAAVNQLQRADFTIRISSNH